jgi:hypothetical protein
MIGIQGHRSGVPPCVVLRDQVMLLCVQACVGAHSLLVLLDLPVQCWYSLTACLVHDCAVVPPVGTWTPAAVKCWFELGSWWFAGSWQ